MKIAIDLRAMDGVSRYRGIGVYIVFLLNNMLPDLLKKHQVVLYVYDKKNLRDIDSSLLGECEIINAIPSRVHEMPSGIQRALLGVAPREYARDKALPGVANADLFFQPYHDFGIPDSMTNKSITVVYDLIPLVYRDAYFHKTRLSPNPKETLMFARERAKKKVYLQALNQINRASKIITISNHTKSDLINRLGVDQKKIQTIFLGPPDVNRGKVRKSFLELLSKGPYVTYVGGIDPRRPIDKFLLRSGDIFIDHGVRTIVAGHDFENIRDPSLKNVIQGGIKSGAITILGHINDAEKDQLIRQSLAFIYPTLYEGFGIPILESFSRETPVVTYKNSSIPEVAESAAIYVNSLDDIPAVVKKLSQDKKYREKIVKKGLEQVKKFSWETCARETQELIESFDEKI